MRPIRILEEIQRNQWAMTDESLRAMLAIVDGLEISADDYKLFHAIAEDEKLAMVDNFGTPVTDTSYTSIRGDVGFLTINGPIIPRATWLSRVSGVASIDQLTAEFKALDSNPSIKKIVLLLDSPGGAITGISDFTALVKASTKQTYGFAWMAASAAYQIATAVDTLVTPDTGLVGSVGTILTMTDTSLQDAKKGIRHISIISNQSPNKRADPTTPEGEAVLQNIVNELADVLIESVATNRDVSAQKVLTNFGAGALVVAKHALSAGMIDAIQDVDSFVKSLSASNTTLSGFTTSAQADNTAETTMGKENEELLTAKELADSQPKAFNTIVASAADKERERIQAIEALAAKFDNALPSVKAAAVEVINKEKFDPEATAASVGLLVIDAVSGAQVNAVDTFAEGRRDAAGTAASLGRVSPVATTEEEKVKASETRVSGLVKAREARMGGVA